MQTAEAFEKEKLEVDVLLASGIFSRAPNLAHLLKYVCDKYFEGAAEEIKEYNIAVEALGRRPEFDQKRDSIVRVEAHRLRKRLREYYETEGAQHELHIEIPSGQYTPKFIFTDPVHRPAAAAVEALAAVEETRKETAIVPAEHEPVAPVRRAVAAGFVWRWVGLAMLTLCAVAGGILVMKIRAERPVLAREMVALARPGDEIRILCGVESGSYTDAFERTWQSDRYFKGGGPVRGSAGPNCAGNEGPADLPEPA